MAETMQVSAQRAWTHLKKYQPLIHELVSRDLKVKYRRSFLGYKHHLFVHVPQRYPKLPALPDLRQHPVYLFQ